MTEGVGRRIVTLMRARGELQDESAQEGLYLPDIGEPEEAAYVARKETACRADDIHGSERAARDGSGPSMAGLWSCPS